MLIDGAAAGRAGRSRLALLLVCLFAAALTLAGCGSTPKRGGGFYQDDGPPREAPRDLERTPDAVPRVEPFHPFANRPYTALGRSYTPITDDRAFRQRGLASWYGRQFHGNKTASGERYDMLAMTAAHPTLPIPSYVRVTNVKSGASVIVRVNDRGPFKPDRIIDLSYAAATRLGIAAAGTGEVEVVRLTHADIRAGRYGTNGNSASSAGSAPNDAPQRAAVSQRAPLPPPSATTASPAPSSAAAVPAPPVIAPAAAVVATSAAATAAGTAPVAAAAAAPSPSAAAPMPAGSWAVQLGAFEQAANAEALRERLALLLGGADGFSAEERAPRVQRDGGVHRVLIGQFGRREEAQALAARLERALDRDTSLYVAR